MPHPAAVAAPRPGEDAGLAGSAHSCAESSGGDLSDGDDLIFPGNSSTAFEPGQTGITLGSAGFRYLVVGSSTYIGMTQINVMTQANSDNAKLALTYTITSSNKSNGLAIAMTSNDQTLDTTVGTRTYYFEPTVDTFQLKRNSK